MTDSQPPVRQLQAAPRKSRIGLVIVGVVIATVLGIGAVVAVLVFKVNEAAHERRDEVEAKRQQIVDRANQIQRETQERAEALKRAALDQAAKATEEALDRAAPARSAEAGDKAEAPGPDLSLPEQPDRAAVLRKLRALDVSKCRGDFAITFTVRVKPDGTTAAPTMGPLRAENADIMCVRNAITTLTFPKSQRGLALRHELRGGKFK